MTVSPFRRVAAAFTFALLGAALSGQAALTSRPAPNSRLVFAELQHDFGRIRDDKPVEWKFTFTNSSDAPVTVVDVRTSCGCTTTATAKKAYAPGESGEITASFSPVNRQGKERKTIKVVTDDPAAKEIELAIVVEIIPRIGIDPAAVYLGELRFDSVAPTNLKRPFTITSRVPALEIKSATIDDARFTIQPLPAISEDVGGEKVVRFPFEVSLTGNLPIGRHQTMLRIATNDTARAKIDVPVILESVGDLRVAPSPVPLPMADGGIPVEQVVTITARNNKPFHILEATATSPQMTFTTEIEQVNKNSDLAWRVKIKGTSPAAGASVTGSLKLKTDAPTQPEIDIPITGYVLRPAQK